MREQLPPDTVIWHGVVRITCVALGTTLVFALMPFEDGKWWLDALIGAAAIAAIIPLTIHRVREIKVTTRPTMAAVEALVLLFTLLIYGFSALFLSINQDATQFEGMDTRVDAVYFAVTTLSTVGFGDVHAVGQAARLAVIAQIVVDFTLLAISARLLLAAAKGRLKPVQQALSE